MIPSLMSLTPTSFLPPDAAAFRTTRWTRVCLAKADTDEGRKALAELCEAYYEPVVTFMRCRLRDADAARDVSHAFFAQVLKGGSLDTADRERGRFRSYLLGAAKHFLSHTWEAARRQKRGGGVEHLDLDDSAAVSVPDEAQLTADAEFDRQWALTLLARALDTLRQEWPLEGKREIFDQFGPWLTGSASHGDQEQLAASLGWSSGTVKSTVHRLRRRFRELVKSEIAGTLSDDASVEEEMQALFAALRGS
jgi:RNA polymerase sigma factor (sigma-70 family)